MLTLALCSCLAVQPAFYYPAAPADALDWAFEDAQEAWIVTTLPPGTDPLTSAPREVRRWINQLGSDCYRCRDLASDKLRGMGPRIAPWLFRARLSPDKEIWLRSGNIIRHFAACKMCEGRGFRAESWGDLVCTYCQGGGRMWPLEFFVPQIGG
jgi:hypothetical protein